MSKSPNYYYLSHIISNYLSKIPRESRRYDSKYQGRIIIDDPWEFYIGREKIYPFQSKKIKVTERLISFLISNRNEESFSNDQKEVIRILRDFRVFYRENPRKKKKTDSLMHESDFYHLDTRQTFFKFRSNLCNFLEDAFFYRSSIEKPKHDADIPVFISKKNISHDVFFDKKFLFEYEDARLDDNFSLAKISEAKALFYPCLNQYERNLHLENSFDHEDAELKNHLAFFNKKAFLLQSKLLYRKDDKLRFARTKYMTKTFNQYYDLVIELFHNNEIPEEFKSQLRYHAEHPYEKEKTKEYIKKLVFNLLNEGEEHSKIITVIGEILDSRADMVMMFSFEQSEGDLRKAVLNFLNRKIHEKEKNPIPITQLSNNPAADGFLRYFLEKPELFNKQSGQTVSIVELEKEYQERINLIKKEFNLNGKYI